jgi:hypothetical protein
VSSGAGNRTYRARAAWLACDAHAAARIAEGVSGLEPLAPVGARRRLVLADATEDPADRGEREQDDGDSDDEERALHGST